MIEAACPYCLKILSNVPKRKFKCPYCAKDIYVRAKQALFESHLLSEEESQVVDWFNKLQGYGFTRDDFRRKKEELAKKFKIKPPLRDIIWGLFQEAIMKNADSYHFLSIINYEMAVFLDEEGKNPFHCLYESKKMQLLNYKGTQKVKIISINDRITCHSCKNLNGKIFAIEDALNGMPIPPKDCPFCRCRYVSADFEHI
ncbi:MAG: phage minor head protein [candidate division WOR-3 bacterium]